MSMNEKGGFRPPTIDKLAWRCPACQTFNSIKESKCKKCGADKPQNSEIQSK